MSAAAALAAQGQRRWAHKGMASENNKWLQQALAPALTQRGFKKSGATWRKASADSIEVLNLQGSRWGPSFSVNLGV